jgi:hypothetical protein
MVQMGPGQGRRGPVAIRIAHALTGPTGPFDATLTPRRYPTQPPAARVRPCGSTTSPPCKTLPKAGRAAAHRGRHEGAHCLVTSRRFGAYRGHEACSSMLPEHGCPDHRPSGAVGLAARRGTPEAPANREGPHKSRAGEGRPPAAIRVGRTEAGGRGREFHNNGDDRASRLRLLSELWRPGALP